MRIINIEFRSDLNHAQVSKPTNFSLKNNDGFVCSIQIPLFILLAPSSSVRGANLPPIYVWHHPGCKLIDVCNSFRYLLYDKSITGGRIGTKH